MELGVGLRLNEVGVGAITGVGTGVGVGVAKTVEAGLVTVSTR